MTFFVHRTRFEFIRGRQPGTHHCNEINRIRGSLGAELRRMSIPGDGAYSKWFDPRWPSGPSGYLDAPRSFVLRWTDPTALDWIGFDSDPPAAAVEHALQKALVTHANAQSVSIRRIPPLHLPIAGSCGEGQLRLRFATPIELKTATGILHEPDFSALAKRLTERIWALGRRYQGWPPDNDLNALLGKSMDVRTLGWDWKRESFDRLSARSGQVHEVGGYTGWAEYEGPLGAFLPLLEIGRWTGVGRQTVWGQGEIRIEKFTPEL